MLQTQLLRAAAAALSLIDAIRAMRTARSDILSYPEFEAAMQSAGGFAWKAYPVTTGSGY